MIRLIGFNGFRFPPIDREPGRAIDTGDSAWI
jgi:hypothetical protein